MEVSIAGRTLELVQGDITEMDTDAIVNAANCSDKTALTCLPNSSGGSLPPLGNR